MSRKEFLRFFGIGAVIGALGALIGLGLSSLPFLVISGIVAAVPATLLLAYFLYDQEKEFSQEDLCYCVSFCAVSATIGVSLAAVAMAIFPSGMLSAALACAAIGVIAPIVTFFHADAVTGFVAEKVNEHVISPIVELFSSKEQGV